MAQHLTVQKISVVLGVESVDDAVDFYKKAFGAVNCRIPSRPENELIGIQAKKLDILPDYTMLITDSPQVPRIAPNTLNLCLQVEGDLADLQRAVSTAVNAGATSDRKVLREQVGSSFTIKVEDPFGVVWFLYEPSDDEIQTDIHRDYELDGTAEELQKTDEDGGIWSPISHYRYSAKLKILVKLTRADAQAALNFYGATFGAFTPQFYPTENEVAREDATALEFAPSYFILISGSAPSKDLSSCINLAVMTPQVELLVERLLDGGATLESGYVRDYYLRQMATVRDPFGVLWFIYQQTLEEEFADELQFLKVPENPRPRLSMAILLREEAAREGRVWPDVETSLADRIAGLEMS